MKSPASGSLQNHRFPKGFAPNITFSFFFGLRMRDGDARPCRGGGSRLSQKREIECPNHRVFIFNSFPGPKTRFDLVLVPKTFLLARIFNSSYNNLCPRTYVRTDGRRRISPGPRPPPIPDRGRACMRILYREVTSSVPPLQYNSIRAKLFRSIFSFILSGQRRWFASNSLVRLRCRFRCTSVWLKLLL